MAKNKKPTMLQVVQVMNHVIQDIKNIESSLSALGAAFDMYVEFKGDSKKFEQLVKDELKKAREKVNEKENV